jgi:ketosteroid isomerase-like protein
MMQRLISFMRNIWLLILGVCLLFNFVFQDLTSASLNELVETERAFAKLASDTNTPEAFLANINNESIAIEGDKIVKMQDIWKERKPNASLLSWQPVFADIASSNDFGYTTGPWSYHATKVENPVACGEYITVWKKQADLQWKIIIDIGITHPCLQKNPLLAFSSVHPKKSTKVSDLDFKNQLLTIESNFIKSLSVDIHAYEKNKSKELRLYRNNAQPITNSNDVQKRLQAEADLQLIYNPLSCYVASSGDLGFVAGSCSVTSGEKTGKYIRIWKKEDGKHWKIVLDMAAL